MRRGCWTTGLATVVDAGMVVVVAVVAGVVVVVVGGVVVALQPVVANVSLSSDTWPFRANARP